MTSWRELIIWEMKEHGEAWADVVSCTLTEEELDRCFHAWGYGFTHGVPFSVWTVKRVYFPVAYDGAEGCGSVSRHPDGKATKHIGD